ncbi:MAG: TIGR02281 family clan AA aspartic protease [Parvularculales bacterium]
MRDNRLTWLALLGLGLTGLVLFLAHRSPNALSGRDSQIQLVYGLALLSVIGGSVVLGWQQRATLALKQALIWCAITLVLIILYSYRDAFVALGDRIAGEITPAQPITHTSGSVSLQRDTSGHFRVNALINGTHVQLLADTGATDVSLTLSDARRVGIDMTQLAFTHPYQTANGVILGAPIKIHSIKIGSIVLNDVRGSVLPAGSGVSLLGMSFLGNLKTLRIDGDRMVMEQ